MKLKDEFAQASALYKKIRYSDFIKKTKANTDVILTTCEMNPPWFNRYSLAETKKKTLQPPAKNAYTGAAFLDIGLCLHSK